MKLEIHENLQHGFAIIKKENSRELSLVRMLTDKDGNVYKYDEYIESKFRYRLITEYEKQLRINKKLIMNIEETLQGLTIPELQSLLPSYYQLAIEARIKELQEKENAVAKTKRTAKATTKKRNRSRNIQA